MTFLRIAHISDTHIWNKDIKFKAAVSQILNYPKRISGYLNIKLNRGPKVFSTEIFRLALRDIGENNVHHLVHTGDLTNMSIEDEFIITKNIINTEYLQRMKDHLGGSLKKNGTFDLDKSKTTKLVEEEVEGEEEKGIGNEILENKLLFSVVPGNHDLYVKTNEFFFGKHFHEFFEIDENKKNCDLKESDLFPNFKFLENNTVLLVLMNTSFPRGLFICGGGNLESQIIVARRKLTEKKFSEILKKNRTIPIVCLHHSPILQFSGNPRILENYVNLPATDKNLLFGFCKDFGIKLILHGHTHSERIEMVKKSDIVAVDAGSVNHKNNASYKILEFDLKLRKLIKIETRYWNEKLKAFETTEVMDMKFFEEFSKSDSINIPKIL